MCKKIICSIIFALMVVVSQVKADSLGGLPDVTVVDGAIISLQHAGTEYVVADGALMLGTTSRWYIDGGVETLWTEGDPAPAATVSGTSNPKEGDVGSKADNFLLTLDGNPNICSIDGIDFQETIFPSPTNTVFLLERGGNDTGTWQGILEDGTLGAEVAFDKASNGGPYADTGAESTDQGAYGVVFTTDVPIIGVRITASGHDTLSISIPAPVPEPIFVDPGSDLEAATSEVQPRGSIIFAEGTYFITSQIIVKNGVTYKGAGPGLTIIDGNDMTRAFAAWGDRGATNGQVDDEGNGIPNLTGPARWIIEGMTIQNCVADANNRQDILSSARDLLNNYTGTPYTLATAQEENGVLNDNPDWFDILSGGADDDLTDVELQAYLDDNPPGSEGHYVVNDNMNPGGGALILRNSAAGTVRNCSFLNNQAPLNSGDGGAINMGLGSGAALIIDNCEFNGNSCIDGGGAMRINGGSACTITGTIFTENQAVDESGDGGAIMTSGSGVALVIDDCEFNDNSCIDAGGAVRLHSTGSTNTITGTTFTGNYIVESDGDGGAIRVTGDDSTYELADCAFLGNYAADDGGAVRYGPDRSEAIVKNCIFVGNGKDPNGVATGDDGGVWSTNDDDAGPITFMNCLFVDNASNDDRIVEVKAVFSILNCTFIGNVAGDEALIGVRGRDWDSTGDGNDDVTTDDSIIANCLFINNTLLSNKEVIGDTRNDVFAPTVINCLFFGNLDQNGEPAINTDDNSVEVGTVDVSGITDASQIVVDPESDYRPAFGSPAIDASDPNTATDADIKGTAAVNIRDAGAYESNWCVLTISPTNVGSVTTPGEGTFVYECGSEVPVEAKADEFYNFVTWSGSAVDAGKVADPRSASTTVLVDGDCNLKANFIYVMFELTVSSTDGGSVIEPGEGGFAINSTLIQLKAVADPHYKFVNWTGSAVDADLVEDPDSADTRIYINRDCNVKANFVKATCTLTISSTEGGSVTTPGEGAFVYDIGTEVGVVATPDAHYHFVGWTGTAVNAGKVADPGSASTTVTADGDYTLIANFEIDKHTLTISSNAGGSVTTPGEGVFEYDYGTVVDLVATADPNHRFKYWIGPVADKFSASTTVTITEDIAVCAIFVKHRSIIVDP